MHFDCVLAYVGDPTLPYDRGSVENCQRQYLTRDGYRPTFEHRISFGFQSFNDRCKETVEAKPSSGVCVKAQETLK